MASEEELAGVRARLFGLIAEERIVAVDVDRPAGSLLEELRAMADVSSTVADALDELGVGGAIDASTLVPRLPGTRVVGPAITIRYAPQGGSVGDHRARGERARLADRDLYNVGRPGDVGVFDCGAFAGASVMGGLSAAWAARVGIAGCVVDGAVRDIDSIRAEGVPVWSRALTPVSGKHRLEAVEINGRVELARVAVAPGDVIVADETGVCVIPAAQLSSVLERCRETAEAERVVTEAIKSSASVEEVARILRPDRW